MRHLRLGGTTGGRSSPADGMETNTERLLWEEHHMFLVCLHRCSKRSGNKLQQHMKRALLRGPAAQTSKQTLKVGELELNWEFLVRFLVSGCRYPVP